jgi:4-amino-4-deoxy-L-arabinose transferase-like glycosyltransferase
VEPEAPGADRGARDHRRGDGRAARGTHVLPGGAPAALAAALGGALLLRLPFLGLPLTADEGGYAEVARLWQHGHRLYGGLFVDRPQGLLLVYRLLLDLGANTTEALRAGAVVAGLATVIALAVFVTRVGGRINGAVAALLLGTAGATPFVESFTLSGELLASFAAVCALAVFAGFLRDGRLAWAAGAGVLCGCAVMVKQSGLDAPVAIGLFLAWKREWRALGVVVAAACVPVVLGVLTASSAHGWWEAVVAYRGQGDSLVTGSLGGRLHQFWDTAPAAALALGPLAVVAAFGFGRSHLLMRFWLLGAAIGVLGGGNFHAHYYVQLAAPLAALGAYGVERLGRPALVAVVAVAVVSTGALALTSRTTQTRTIWPHDPHLRYDAAVVRLIRDQVPRGQEIAVTWGDADLYFLADRDPAVYALWYRNAQAIPGVAARDIAAVRRGVPLVVALEPSLRAFPALRAALRCNYREVLVAGPLHVYRRGGGCP